MCRTPTHGLRTQRRAAMPSMFDTTVQRACSVGQISIDSPIHHKQLKTLMAYSQNSFGSSTASSSPPPPPSRGVRCPPAAVLGVTAAMAPPPLPPQGSGCGGCSWGQLGLPACSTGLQRGDRVTQDPVCSGGPHSLGPQALLCIPAGQGGEGPTAEPRASLPGELRWSCTALHSPHTC